MEQLLDEPEWLWGTAFAFVFILVLFVMAVRNTRQQIAQTRQHRANPTREEFMAMLANDVSQASASSQPPPSANPLIAAITGCAGDTGAGAGEAAAKVSRLS